MSFEPINGGLIIDGEGADVVDSRSITDFDCVEVVDGVPAAAGDVLLYDADALVVLVLGCVGADASVMLVLAIGCVGADASVMLMLGCVGTGSGDTDGAFANSSFHCNNIKCKKKKPI